MKLLIAIHGSPESEPPVHAVLRRPWPAGSRVRVLTVVEPAAPASAFGAPDLGASPVATQALVEAQEVLTREAEARLGRVAEQLAGSGLGVETAVRHGEPSHVIVEEAGSWGADLVLVGTHGRTGLKRLLLGSVAQRVVSHAPCSVEVVRLRGDGERG